MLCGLVGAGAADEGNTVTPSAQLPPWTSCELPLPYLLFVPYSSSVCWIKYHLHLHTWMCYSSQPSRHFPVIPLENIVNVCL